MMTKDVIYIDVEDDITTIVGKIKDSKEKIIAIVPPSRVGVLQSAVNMRLLQRTAETAKKRLVLISNNQSLAALAAAAQIPVAKNLQSKPELAEIPVLKMDGDDVIDGKTLPIGELSRSSTSSRKSDTAVDRVIKASAIAQPVAKASKSKKDKKEKTKVPNFSSFRKKFFVIGGAALALIVFLVWAIWFAPRATVVITAKTTTATVDRTVSLSSGGETSAEKGTIKSIRLEEKGEITVEFNASGKKNVGDKATAPVKLSNRSSKSQTIAQGTVFTKGDLGYSLTSAVTVPAATLDFECSGLLCPGEANGTIQAVEGGTKYNGATGTMAGAPSSITVRLADATGGGTDKTATVVSEADVAKAAQSLSEKSVDSLESKLSKQFGKSSVLIDDSYQESRSEPAPGVAVGAEASGPVTLKSTITASMTAIDKDDLATFLEESIDDEIKGKTAQKIYSDGSKDVKFSQFDSSADGSTVRLTANGTVGPAIDEKTIKDQARGKSYGDIQASLESIEGVDDVDTKFWPFWVRTVPDDTKRITVEFKLQDAK